MYVMQNPPQLPDVSPEPRSSLSAETWAQAALDAMAQGGLAAVAVEPLARRLGVTKGSFYWHFTSREALLKAALDLWERRETTDVLARAGDVADPYERIVKLFREANTGYRSGRLHLAIAAAQDQPLVQACVQRVSGQRMRYLQQCYAALGFDAVRAEHWARFAYATFMGNLQIRRDTPELMPQGAAFNDYLKLMIRTLIPREGADDGATPPSP